jgi:type II secretory pathway pseudopilin PulG
MRPASVRRSKPSEEGYVLVAVMFMLALLIIAMAVALPRISASIQRDRELETWHRGMQYRRAIQLYYRKFNRYPPNLDALVKTNEIRFLRKKYKDPTTGKDEWKPIMLGQNKTPLAMGFFGQPLTGVGMGGLMAGVGPSGGNGIAGASPVGGAMGSINATGTDTSGAAAGATGTSGASTDPGLGGTTGSGTQPGGTQPGGTQPGGTSTFGGQTFGGAGIIGVSPMSPKQSILVYKKKNHYNEWEFLYSPLSEQGMMPNNMNNGIQPSTPGVGAPGTVFSPGGGTGGGLSPTPTPTPGPTSPQ